MRPMLAIAAALLATMAQAQAQAQTLRWSSAGDVQTLDPYSQNELLTNSFNGQIHDFLVTRDQKLGIVPGLAASWTQDGPLKWTFKLRPGVKFHEGQTLSADDVVFSVNRAKEKTSQIAAYANALGEPKKIDELTVEFNLKQFNPIFLQHLNLIFIMNRAWCEEHKIAKPLDFTNKEETYASLHANGTGPYRLVSRAPDVKTVLERFPGYWGKVEGNVQQVVYTPIKNPATRISALVSGELDLLLDPPPTDLERLGRTPGIKVIEGQENRIIYIGMDQARDELLYASVKGKNPFKDLRVRQALYQAIDIETLKTKLMNGQAAPTGALAPSSLATFDDPELEQRRPYDLAAAKKLMAEAGYADGFEVTLDCPNNRYINDERICITLSSMWAKLNLKVNVRAQPRATYFPKLEKLDTSLYLFGWGGAITDAEVTFTPLFRNRGEGGVGFYNYGGFKDDELDALAAASSIEADPDKRKALIKQTFRRQADQVHYIPLHRQFIPWAVRDGVKAVHRPDNWLEIRWVTIGK